MGTIKTTNIETITGSGTLTLGQSGETISVPSGATLDLSNATQTGVGGVMTPSFFARLSATTSVTDGAWTKVVINSEIFDSDSNFDTSNGRFTPTVAGKYFVFGQVMGYANTNNLVYVYSAVYKNGSFVRYSNIDFDSTYGREASVPFCHIFDMNGSSDYLELYANVNSANGSTQEVNGNNTWFGAYRIIGA